MEEYNRMLGLLVSALRSVSTDQNRRFYEYEDTELHSIAELELRTVNDYDITDEVMDSMALVAKEICTKECSNPYGTYRKGDEVYILPYNAADRSSWQRAEFTGVISGDCAFIKELGVKFRKGGKASNSTTVLISKLRPITFNNQ